MAERRLDADQLPTMKQIWSPGQGLRGLGTESLSAGRRPRRLPTNAARSHRASSPSERCHTAPSHTWPSPHTVLCRRASTCKKTTEGPRFPREKSTFYPCNQRQQREMGSKKMKNQSTSPSFSSLLRTQTPGKPTAPQAGAGCLIHLPRLSSTEAEQSRTENRLSYLSVRIQLSHETKPECRSPAVSSEGLAVLAG